MWGGVTACPGMPAAACLVSTCWNCPLNSMEPMMLNLLIPEFAVLLFMLVWFYRCTGRINLGGLIIASIFISFVAGGSVIAPP